MIEPTAPSQELWQYDVAVTKKGFFTIYAHYYEEAQRMVAEIDLDTRVILWTFQEVTSID